MAPVIGLFPIIAGAIGSAVSAVGGIGTVLGLAGAGLGAVGALSAGQAESSTASTNAAIASIRGQEAQYAATEDARKARIQARRIIGQQRAGLAKSGVQLDSESALLIEAETALEGERDASLIERAGAVEEALFKAQSELYKKNAKAARTASYFKAGGTLLAAGAGAFRSGGRGSGGSDQSIYEGHNV